MSQDNTGLNRATTGEALFLPFEENLSAEVLEAMQRFQVRPLGGIRASPRHIPYNSEKKNFWAHTGRDSLETFRYTFQPNAQSDTYTVMWDYNIGLVRITPFFKCFKYSKTTPAKMLHTNDGLKAITHSITGGALDAQGYWMPYLCAKAVCARFCYSIAAALIPVFGPDFPNICLPRPDISNVSWLISRDIIEEATRTAEAFRKQYSTCSASPSVSPRERIENLPPSGRPKRSKRAFTDSENEVSENSISSLELQIASPPTPMETLCPSNSANFGGWTPVQKPHSVVGQSRSTFPHPKQYRVSTSRSPPMPTRENHASGNYTSLRGKGSTFDKGGASPYLSAVPGLASSDKRSLLALDSTRPASFSRNSKNKLRARASTNSQVHAPTQSASEGIPGTNGYHILVSARRLETRRSKRRSQGVAPKQNEDYEYDGELETSPGCDGYESLFSSLNASHGGGSGSDSESAPGPPNLAANVGRHSMEERIAADALVRLSLEAFGANEQGATSRRIATSTEAEGRVGMSNGDVDEHGDSNGSLGDWTETQTEEAEMVREKAGAKRRRIKTI